MKKIISLFMAGLLLLGSLSLVGCDLLEQFLGHDDPPLVEGGGDDLPGEADPPKTEILVDQDLKEEIYNGTYETETESPYNGSYYGVGRTLNVVEDPYIEVASGYAKVFDTEKLLNMNWRTTKVGKMEASTASGSSMSEMFEDTNETYGVSFNGELNVFVFKAGLEAQFDFASGEQYKETSNEVFYTASQIYAATLVEIDGYYDVEQFTDVLSDKLISDAEEVQSGEMSPASFIALYGTHAVLAGYYGGKVDCTYYLRNTGVQWSTNEELNIAGRIGVGIDKLLSVDGSGYFSMQEELGLKAEQSEERFEATSIGGANFKGLSMSDFLSDYGKWVDSMNATDDFGVIVGLPKRSLVAIWDMFPQELNDAKEILASYFEDVAEKEGSEFLSQYERHYTKPVDNGDEANFSGGHGTEESPYLIDSKAEFQNIQKFVGENTYFRLTDSIDLGIWNEPFEFCGHFDGGYNEITYVQTLKGSGDTYGGLFSKLNAAEVQDLYIEASISRDDKNGSTTSVGALAGDANGGVNISRVSVSGRIMVESFDGFDYVGGLVGRFFGGTIAECRNTAEIYNDARNTRAGGISAYVSPQSMTVSIQNCYNTGKLTASSAWTAAFGGRAAGLFAQVRGHNAFDLSIQDCYNDSSVELKWTVVATGGWYGRGGIIGDIEDRVSDNLTVENCWWNSSKCSLKGNADQYQKNSGKSDMTGTYANWSTDVWSFSSHSAPQLVWILENQ